MAEVVGDGGVFIRGNEIIDRLASDPLVTEMDRAVPKLTPFHDAAVTRQRIAEWAIRAHKLGHEGKFDEYTEAMNSMWFEIDEFGRRNPGSKL